MLAAARQPLFHPNWARTATRLEINFHSSTADCMEKSTSEVEASHSVMKLFHFSQKAKRKNQTRAELVDNEAASQFRDNVDAASKGKYSNSTEY